VSGRLTWLSAALVALWLLSCARRDAPERDCPPTADAGALVDPTLLAFLSLSRSAHHKADMKEEAQDLSGAIAELESLVRRPPPGGAEPAPEIREVLADTRARLADLKSRQGLFDDAEREVSSGLELAPEPNYFRGHLFEVRGALEERRAKSLEHAGKSLEAERAKERALTAFEEAIRIQAGVIDRSLKPPDAPR
jgi:tetratricopeptide (TPR) repeat protein